MARHRQRCRSLFLIDLSLVACRPYRKNLLRSLSLFPSQELVQMLKKAISKKLQFDIRRRIANVRQKTRGTLDWGVDANVNMTTPHSIFLKSG